MVCQPAPRHPLDVTTYEHLKRTGRKLHISVFLKCPLTVRQLFRLTSQDRFVPRAPAPKSLDNDTRREVGHIQVCIPPREMVLPVRGRRLPLRSMPRLPNHPRLVRGFWLPGGARRACNPKCTAPRRTPLPEKHLQSRYTLDGKVSVLGHVRVPRLCTHKRDSFQARSRAIVSILWIVT